MYQTISLNDFIHAFERCNRSSNFSTEGLVALFDFFEEVHPNMELDVIAICCDFSEYESLAELKQEYSNSLPEDLEDDEEALDYFRDNATLLELPGGGLVMSSF